MMALLKHSGIEFKTFAGRQCHPRRAVLTKKDVINHPNDSLAQ